MKNLIYKIVDIYEGDRLIGYQLAFKEDKWYKFKWTLDNKKFLFHVNNPAQVLIDAIRKSIGKRMFELNK